MLENVNILIIDDDQKIINALKSILIKNEYILFSATESQKALEIIHNYKIDIIICDYNMPKMTGIDILKILKSVQPNAIRILITGLSDLNVTISAINEVGIFYYITKPWNNNEVLSVIEKAVEEKRIQEKKEELYKILNDSKDYLIHTASKLNTINDIKKDIITHNNNTMNTKDIYKIQISNKKFPVWEDKDIILINSSEICYIEAMDGSVFIVTEKRKYNSPDSLNTWENKLSEDSFFRCHRGYIVNINKIDKISPWFNGAYNLKLKKINETIPVSRSNMKKLRDIFGL